MPDSIKPPELDFSLILGAAVVLVVISCAGIYAKKSLDRQESPLSTSATNTMKPSYTLGSTVRNEP